MLSLEASILDKEKFDEIYIKQKDFSKVKNKTYFGRNKGEYLNYSIAKIIRYACVYYLGWDDERIKLDLSEDILKALNLSKIVKFFMDIPTEMEFERIYFILHLLYPEDFKYDFKELTLMVYKKVMDKEYTKYPKNFFLEAEGQIRAILCMQQALQMHGFKNIRDVYEKFSDKKFAIKFLKSNKLDTAYSYIYNKEPVLKYVHESLSSSQRRDDLYERWASADTKK